jgi:ATP-dependent RNA helicase DeaD
MARIFIGAGRLARLRPQDVVGAITGETRLSGRDIGGIEITDQFTLVEVPQDAVDEVVSALRATTLKGKKVVVRRDAQERRDRQPPS